MARNFICATELRALRLIVIAASLLVAGCVSLPTSRAPAPEAPATPAPEPEQAPEPPPPVVETEPDQKVAKRKVALLVSDSQPVYVAVANELIVRPGGYEFVRYELGGDDSRAREALADIESSGIGTVVAIGQFAGRKASQIDSDRLVICQVLQPQTLRINAKRTAVVPYLPPASQQLIAWKKLSSDLQTVGMLISGDQAELARDAKASADALGLELVGAVVGSDKELQFHFQRMVPKVDGIWLPTDSRIMSPPVIRSVMAYAARHHRAVMVNTPALLEVGALLSITGSTSDVAGRVEAALDALHGAQYAGRISVPLTGIDVRVNPQVARRLGLAPVGEGPEVTASMETTP